MKRLATGSAALLALTIALRVTAPAVQANVSEGREIFRFDTFGDEQLWTARLRMHEAVSAVSPATALAVGLKVDVAALPPAIVEALKSGQVDLTDPAVTIQLLALNAVVGVVGRTGSAGNLESIGITCALCHSTVDDSFAPGMGQRIDGWPNRDLNVGAIVALSPALIEAQKAVFNSWGPGRYDPRLQAFDGTNFITLNDSTFPVLIPPTYGLQRAGFETVTGDGPISYWNSYVAVTQMGGHGSFSDGNLGLLIAQAPDLVTPTLPALLEYQLSLRPPEAPRGSYDRRAARRGEALFSGVARCATCHTPPAFTDVLSGPDPAVPFLHAPAETDMEPEYASRSVTGMYRTAPLRGIWQHAPYFHDGSASDLAAVVDHYDTALSLGLTTAQKADLVEYLKSL